MAKVFFNEETGTIVCKGIKVKPGTNDLMFKNFGGDKNNNNDAGKRNFCIKISEEDAALLEQKLAEAGLQLNIKEWNGDKYFKVIVSYRNYPPTIVRKKVLPNGNVNKTVLNESNIYKLDRMLIADGQFSCTPSYLSQYRTWACYLNSFIFVPLIDPVQEEIDALDNVYPSEDDEVPFE